MAMVRALEELDNIGLENIYNHEKELKEYLIKEMKKINNVIIQPPEAHDQCMTPNMIRTGLVT